MKADYPLEMNYAMYRSLEASGLLVLVGLRRVGSLVGYWTCVTSPFLHSRSLRSASTDLVFIHPEHRKDGAFALLRQGMESVLRHKAVALWYVGEKLANPIGPALRQQGFVADQTVYLKRLGA